MQTIRAQSSQPMHPGCLKRQAIEQLDALYRLALHLSRDPDEAGELVQETFCRALRPGVRFTPGARGIRPWLFKILHNVFLSRAAARNANRSRFVESDSLELVAVADVHDASLTGDDIHTVNWELVDGRLKRAIDLLPPTQRLALLLWAVEGLKYRQIAEVTGVRIGTVMSRLSRARVTLVRQLSPATAELSAC